MSDQDQTDGVSDDDGSAERARQPWSPDGQISHGDVIGHLLIKTDEELAVIKQLLLTEAGGQVLGESTTQTPAQNLLYRVDLLETWVVHQRAGAEAAGDEASLGPVTGPAPDQIRPHQLGP